MVSSRVGGAALVVACCFTSSVLAVCAVDDANFTTADGGCKDVNTGLVWSSDLVGLPGVSSPSTSGGTQQACDAFEARPEAGGFTDWRPASAGEVQEALANGLASHLDFYYTAGNQSVDSVVRFTSCNSPTIKGAKPKYYISFVDGSIGYDLQSHHNICVRGLPNDNDCPGPGKKKNRMGATTALSQTATGALLLLPLAVVLAARCLHPRRA